MKSWKTLSKSIALKNEYISIVASEVETPDGNKSEYFYAEAPGNVIVIPVKVRGDSEDHSYVMVRQYRYPVGSYDYEFPGGRREYGESVLDAARRELKQETGYEAESIKLLYSLYSAPGISNGTTSICLALVKDPPGAQQLDDSERNSNLTVHEVSSPDLHKKILNMDITEPHTLAAICVFILNSKAATEYIKLNSEDR